MSSLTVVSETARRASGISAALAILVLVLGTGPQAADASNPTHQEDGVSAILLDPYTNCFNPTDAWATLNSNWSDYGSVPVSITTGGDLCEGTFTLADLEASGADTVILDSTAYDFTLTAGEIQALQTYVEEGHTLVGEDTIFQWKSKHNDNGLAPLFGLASQTNWYIDGLQGKSPEYQLHEDDPDAGVLFKSVDNPYTSSLYGRGQKPARKKWLPGALAGARYVGITQDKRNAISVYDGSSYTAIYISSQAAFFSTPDDLQFLYNAIIYPDEG